MPCLLHTCHSAVDELLDGPPLGNLCDEHPDEGAPGDPPSPVEHCPSVHPVLRSVGEAGVGIGGGLDLLRHPALALLVAVRAAELREKQDESVLKCIFHQLQPVFESN